MSQKSGPLPPVTDDLEKQKDEDQKIRQVEKQLSQSLKELLELYEEKPEARFAEAIKGLEFQILLERLKNKGDEFDEEAKHIQVEIAGIRNSIIEEREKAEQKKKEAEMSAKQKAEERAMKAKFAKPPVARAVKPKPAEPAANRDNKSGVDLGAAKEMGKKLGFLIAALEISEEERGALFSLLPQMTEAQLTELTNVLEANYLHAASKNPDEQLAGALNNAKEKYQQTIRRVNANTVKELDSIT